MNSKGSITGLLLAGVSVFVLTATVIGIAQNNAFKTSSQAAMNSTSVMLLENSLNVRRIDDHHFEISGKFCYSHTLQSGGHEDWSVWSTDERGKPLNYNDNPDNNDGGKLFVTPLGMFPSGCEFIDRENGIGKAVTKVPKQRFSLIASTKNKLSSTDCPTVYLHYDGLWFSGRPFARFNLKDFPGVCGPSTSPAPTSPAATTAPSPSTAPTGAITGRISVYSCNKPSNVAVEFCTGETCNITGGGKTASVQLTEKPGGNAIWLTDTNDDNTWMYEYNISTDENVTPLDPSKTYYLVRAAAQFDNKSAQFDSTRENADKLRVKPGQKRDFEVYASQTCDCPFDAVSYIKDTSGNYITALDNKPGQYGAANNKQRFDNGDKPSSNPFNNLGNNPGQIDVHSTRLETFRGATDWGLDALAAIKLYADGWRVVRQECISNNPFVPSCPNYSEAWTQTDMTKVRDPRVIEGVRVACGTNVKYGWIVEKASPTPPPAPVGNGRIDVGLFVFLDRDKDTPDSCDLNTLRNTSPADGIERYFHDCEIILRDANTDAEVTRIAKKSACDSVQFENIPAGNYYVQSKKLPSKIGDGCLETRKVTVLPNQTAQVSIVMLFDKDKCEYSHATETTCGNDDEGQISGCKGVGGNCLGRLGGGSWLCCVPKGGGGDGGDGGDGGGSGQGNCSTENGLVCTGTGHGFGSIDDHPGEWQTKDGNAMCRWKKGEDSRVGGHVGWCSPNHDNACCNLNGGGSNPGSPVNPPGGDPVTPPSTNYYECPEGSVGAYGDRTLAIPDEDPIDVVIRKSTCGAADLFGAGSQPVDALIPNNFCCSVPIGNPNDGLGTCTGPTVRGTKTNYARPFSLKSEAEKSCNDDTASTLTCTVVPASNGSGYCCDRRSKANTGKGTCSPTKFKFGQKGTTNPFDTKTEAQASCTVILKERQNTVEKCVAENADGGSGYCSKVTLKNSGGNGDRDSAFGKFKIKYKGTIQLGYTLDIYPKICWEESGREVCDTGASGIFRRPSYLGIGGDYSETVEFSKLHPKKYTIKCEVNVKGGKRQVCDKDITLNIPNDNGKCKEYNISIENGKVVIGGPGGDCTDSTSKKASGLYTIRMNLTKDSVNTYYSERIIIKPYIKWNNGSDDAEKTIELMPGNSGEYTFKQLSVKRYKLGCNMYINGRPQSNSKCNEIEIEIPRQSEGCREYNITFKDDKFTHGVGNFCSGYSADSARYDVDIDHNGTINTIDLQYLYDNYGESGEISAQNDSGIAIQPDVNSDGIINALDVSMLIDAFGTQVPD